MTKATSLSPVAVVVNDDPAQLGELCGLVRAAGLEPRPFASAEAALEALDPKASPALILTNLCMPGIDGWRVCRLLRSPEYAAFNEVPILVVSATFAGDYPERIAADVGADAFLPLPVGEQEFVAQVRALLQGKEARRRPAVLIVEDDPDLSGLLVETFAAHGYLAETAPTAREAEEGFSKQDYDLAVLDYHLPDGTGEALLVGFRTRRPDCACIMITGDLKPELALDWMKRGAAAYLRKPFTTDYLIELCARVRRERALLRAEDLLERRTRELRDEHRRLELILEGTRAGAWEWNVQTGETIFNECWAEIVGYTLAELAPVSSKTWEALTHPDDLARSNELLARHFAGELPYYDCDCRMRHKDGRWVWVRDYGRVHSRTTDGKALWMSGTHIDITDRKAAEEALRRSEERFRLLAENIPGVVYLCRNDERWTMLYLNDAVEEMTGYRKEEFLSHQISFADLYHPDDRAGIYAEVESALSRNASFRLLYRIQHKDGDWRWIEETGIGVPGPDGTVLVEGHLNERTAAMQAETLLRQSEDRYRSLIEYSPDAIGIYQDDRLVFVNPATVRMLGAQSAEELLGLTSAEVVHPEDRPAALDRVRRLMAGESGGYPVEVRYLRRDGSVVWSEVIGSLVQFGGAAAFQFVARDITDRKAAEEALRRSEEQYRLLADNASDNIWVLSLADFRLTYVSPSATRIFGFTPEESTRMSLAEQLPPESLELVKSVLAEELEKERDSKVPRDRARVIEVEQSMKGGGRIWTQITTSFLRDDAGQPVQVLGISRDITERKRAEEELTRATALLQAAVEQTPAGMLIADAPDVTIRMANPAALGIRGQSTGPLTGIPVGLHPRHWLTFWPDGTPVAPEDLPLSRAILKGEIVKNEEVIIRRSDGEARHVLANAAPVRNSQGEIVAGVVVFPDVTELKRSEEAALRTLARRQRESEVVVAVAASANLAEGAMRELAVELTEAAARALEVERVGVWLFAEGETRLVNLDLFVASSGAHSSGAVLLASEFQSEFEALKTAKYVDADDPLTDPRTAGYVGGYLVPNRITSLLDAVIRAGGHNLGVLCFEHVDRSHDWEDDEITFACQLADQLALAVAHRERKRAEAEKENLQVQLTQAQKMESVGRLAGGVAHDFNNMLQAILGNTALALEELPPESPVRESLREVQKCAQRSADLTRQLLAFARKQTIAPKVLDLNETVAGMLKMLRRLIGEDIDLAWLPGADLGLVHMDPSQVDQILANLCVNARDAIGGGVGKVTIETANAVCDEAYGAERPEARAGQYVRLAVSDNGCGMSLEVRAHLFEPFFTTKGVGQGTGLGLATVYGIVKQNHGFINVYSEPGQGTTFRIYLPRHTLRAAHLAGNPSAPAPRRGEETILLVEDEPSILRVSQRLLESLGYRVLTAHTPGEAVQLAREHVGEIHLLMTDVIMPEMNGRDLAKNLLSQYPNLKRLFMSGYTANVIAHHGVLDPGVHFLQKPFSVQTLAEKVRQALDV